MMTPQLDMYKHLSAEVAGRSVLEVGFGTGFGVLQYAPWARSVLAIDSDVDAVSFAANSFPIKNVQWSYYDILQYEDPNEKYDVAIMVEVLEHIKPWRAALRNICAHLHKDGKLIMSARNAFADLRHNGHHEREWTALELCMNLGRFFEKVTLYDYELKEELDEKTRKTPLFAIGENPK
jgi:2-polyprenyl-3-methyl-5-hydroxy-6-metoxy-1,4-benzoquinol methylase